MIPLTRTPFTAYINSILNDTRVEIADKISGEIDKVLDSGLLSKGEKVKQFEQKVADYVGTKHAVALNSCTSGLQVVLEALDIGARDKVICPNFTYWSTPQAIRNVGAEPVFVDVKDDYCSFDGHYSHLRRHFATIRVDLFGNYSLSDWISGCPSPTIRDAACGLGLNYKSFEMKDIILVFSFHPRKIITTGEGGMICTNDSELAYKLRLLCGYETRIHKYNLRMNEIQAVMGLVQMEYLDDIIADRQRAAKIYDDLIIDMDRLISIHPHQDGVNQTYQSYVCLIDSEYVSRHMNNHGFIGRMLEYGVETQVGSYFVDERENYPNFALNTNGFKFGLCCLSLPIYYKITEETQQEVIQKLGECLK